jgi:hypothetical protein
MSETPGEEQGVPVDETPQEAQRNLATVLVNDLNQVGVKAVGTAVGAVAGYGIKKALDKKFSDRGPDAKVSKEGEDREPGPPEE